LSSEPGLAQVKGDHVWVAAVREQDIAPYRRAVEHSRLRLARWNAVDPDDLVRHLRMQSPSHRTFLIHALDPEGDHAVVGKVNVTDVVRGRFESAAIGYDAYDPYAGRGLFGEGLRLILSLAFRPEAEGGMGLHRVAAAVQPGNVRSAGLLRSLGFQREGFSRRMLWLPGADGNPAWQDHVTYALIRDEWPATPYPPPRVRKVVVLVNGVPEAGKALDAPETGARTLARRLAAELRVPLFAGDVITGRVMWALLGDSPAGGVVESSFLPDDVPLVIEGLRGCGLDPAAVPEVWCFSGRVEAVARPLGLGPKVLVDTGRGVGRGDIVRIALQVSGTGVSSMRDITASYLTNNLGL